MWIVIVVLAIVVVVALVLMALYNGLVKKRNRVDSAWSDIDVQLRRRYDLIPNLVETVRGYASHEQQTLDAVINARNAGLGASSVHEAAQADGQLTGALRQLLAITEAYPDLKANQNFLALQEELTGTEGRIAYARQYYNDSVRDYNTSTQTFPSVVFANMFGFKEREYYEIADAVARGPVDVAFQGGQPAPADAPPVAFDTPASPQVPPPPPPQLPPQPG